MARKRIDITGDRYGRLVVLKEVEPSKTDRRWLCKCDCGEEKEIPMNRLRTGHTQSCGCLQRERASLNKRIDLTGKRFGKLLVLGESISEKRKGVYWDCRCDCGELTTVNTNNLTSGKSKSCGCSRVEYGKKVKEHLEKNYRKKGVMTTSLKRKANKNNKTGIKGVSVYKVGDITRYRAFISVDKENIYLGTFNTITEAAKARRQAEKKFHRPYLDQKKGNRLDLSGHRYGRLTVLREGEKKGKERGWVCKCDCGEELTVAQVSLRTGNTQSCGCQLRENAGRYERYRKEDFVKPLNDLLKQNGGRPLTGNELKERGINHQTVTKHFGVQRFSQIWDHLENYMPKILRKPPLCDLDWKTKKAIKQAAGNDESAILEYINIAIKEKAERRKEHE